MVGLKPPKIKTRKLVRIERTILGILDSGERSSADIAAALIDAGFWFVRGRVWPALRHLERMSLIERRTVPGGPERGGYSKNYFKIKRGND